MSSIQIGPFMFSTGLFIVLASFLCASIVAAVADRKRKTFAESAVFWGALWALLIGRLVYVLEHWADYHDQFLAIVDIRDGNLTLWAAALAALLYWAWRVRRQAAIFPPLAWSLGTALILASVLHVVLLSGQGLTGQAFPDMQVQSLDQPDKHVSLSDFSGKPVVLNLWASWCGPCRREMPAFEQAQREYPQFHFVFFNQGENAQAAQRFLQDEGLALHNVYLDQAQQALNASESVGLPTTLFLDAQGQVLSVRAGELTLPALRIMLKQISP